MNDQARAAVLGWQNAVDAAWEQRQAGLLASAPPPHGPVVERGLTPEEIAIARSVFGNALNTDQIKLTDNSPSATQAVAYPNHIQFPWGTFDKPPDKDYRAWLIHELTHIWQYQQGHSVLDLAMSRNYDYGGEPELRRAAANGKLFGDFGYEEQGDILRDYYRAREEGHDTSAYQPFVDQVQSGTAELRLYPEPAPPPGPAF